MATPQLSEVSDAPTGKKKTKRLVAPRETHRELIYRANMTGWTPERVLRARSMADSGLLLEAADFVETMLSDDRIKGVLSTRTNGLLGLPVDFKGGTPEARKILQGDPESDSGDDGEWWAMHDESELVKLQTWGLGLGVGLAQRIELPRVLGANHRYRIETWSPRWLTYHQIPINGSHWSVQTLDGQKTIAPGDGEWIIYTPYGARRPWAEGLWTALAFPWLLKHFSLEDRANYSEALGNPIWLATTGSNSTEKQRNALLSQLANTGKSQKFVFPEGWKLDLVEATGKSFEIYEGQVEWADQAITIAIAGQIVTTEGMSGFSSGNIHDSIKQDLIRFDGTRLATAIHKQSLQPWALMNFGARTAAPRAVWETQQPENMDDQAKSIGDIGDAIARLTAALAPYGMTPNAAEIVAKFGIPVLNTTKTPPAMPPPVKTSRKK